MNTNKKKLRYIYNPAQAQFYMDNGLKLIKTNYHDKTGNQFWVFLDGIAQTALFREWCNRSK